MAPPRGGDAYSSIDRQLDAIGQTRVSIEAQMATVEPTQAVRLADGSVKWDMINGIGVHMFGHSDRDMIRASLEGAVSDTVMQGNLQYNQDAVDFASHELANIPGDPLAQRALKFLAHDLDHEVAQRFFIDDLIAVEVGAQVLVDLRLQGHFRGFWTSVPQSVEFMARGEVDLQSMFSPGVSALTIDLKR